MKLADAIAAANIKYGYVADPANPRPRHRTKTGFLKGSPEYREHMAMKMRELWRSGSRAATA